MVFGFFKLLPPSRLFIQILLDIFRYVAAMYSGFNHVLLLLAE